MNRYDKYWTFMISVFTALALLSPGSRRFSALAEGPAPVTKGPEVSTVGTGPYLGPLPDEVAKLAQLEAAAVTPPAPGKEPAAATITTGGGNVLTVAELAKLAALKTLPAKRPVPTMSKPVLKKGQAGGTVPVTAQEREKTAKTVEKTETGKTNAAPSAPQPAPKVSR
jgi:hypothetical protein